MESRSKKSARNIATGFAGRLVMLIFAFVTKTIFIRLLGAEYNGVSGLYSNILSILSLSELGIGNVLNYSLYQALNEKNELKIRSLVYYFKKIYIAIAIAIFMIGLLLLPVLPYIVNSSLPYKELAVYYLLYLLNSVVSYFVVYKTTVISADQNSYIITLCDTISTLVMYIIQIVYLMIFHNFIGYLLIQVMCTIIRNAVLICIAEKKYPYLKVKQVDKYTFDRRKIIDNIKSTFIYKISTVALNNIDNILISVMVSTVAVGYYSNYWMIVSFIGAFVSAFILGITASLGNLNARNDKEASFQMFSILMLIFNFIGTVVACCFLNCIQVFIPVWIGKECVMPFSWVIVIVFNNYLNQIMNPCWMFVETMGLFREVRYLMPISALLNLIFSVILGQKFGVPGILIATQLAKLFSEYWYEPRILFRKKFQQSELKFYAKQLKQMTISLFTMITTYLVCKMLPETFGWIFVRAIFCTVFALIVVWVTNRNSIEWKMIYDRYIVKCKKIIKEKMCKL